MVYEGLVQGLAKIYLNVFAVGFRLISKLLVLY